MKVTLEVPVEPTARVLQLRGSFDLPDAPSSKLEWDVAAPVSERPWSVGLVTGPSGSGKSTAARHLFPPGVGNLWSDALTPWPDGRAVVDGFPAGLPLARVAELLSAVGFSSPPAWLRPYRALSTGQRFRCDLARLLAAGLGAPGAVLVCDEFTAVIDRTVARVGSAALAKSVRRHGLRFVAVTCHEDVTDWLQPEWVYRPELDLLPRSPGAGPAFTRRCLRPRPPVELEVYRCTAAAWGRFAPHHYLSGTLHRSAACFVACHGGEPVAFTAWLNHFSRAGGRREHRTVVLPDWQGAGVGTRLSSLAAAMWKALGLRAVSTTGHPGLIAARKRSPDWRLTRPPGLANRGGEGRRHAVARLTAGFEYVGPALPAADARRLLGQ